MGEAAKQRRDRDRAEREAAAILAQEIDEIDGWIRRLDNYIDDADRKDPNNYAYTYYERSRLLTPDSQAKWRQRTDEAITAWQTVMAGIDDIAARMKRSNLDASNPGVKADLEATYERAQMAIDRLTRARNRYYW